MTRRELWRRWVLGTTVGEVAGFCAPAVAGTLTYRSPAGVGYVALLAAGAVEGLCLGWAQGWALAPVLPTLPRRRFAVATAVAAVVAYALGMLPSTLHDQFAGLPPWLLWPLAAVGAVVLLGSIGTAQRTVLRAAGCPARWWVLTTAGGWLAGLAVFMLVATPLWRPGQAIGLTVAIGVLAAVAMALTVAVVTGHAAVRLTPDQPGSSGVSSRSAGLRRGDRAAGRP